MTMRIGSTAVARDRTTSEAATTQRERDPRATPLADGARCTVVSRRGAPQQIDLVLSDFNRLRWTVAALQTNDCLLASVTATPVRAGERRVVVDSTGAAARSGRIPHGAHVIHWDGYNSHLEMLQACPELARRDDLRYVAVGHLEDLRSAYNVPPLQLYAPDTRAEDFCCRCGNVSESRLFTARRMLTTRLRHLKNGVVDPERHRRLQRGGLIVFCGAVRVTGPVVENIFRGSCLDDAKDAALRLVGMPLVGPRSAIEPLIVDSFEALRRTSLEKPADVAAAYAQLNMLQRMATIAALNRMTARLFVSEYGFDRHLDPYDSTEYRNNIYLDFGSTRGVENFYPRAVDIASSGKKSLSFRLFGSAGRLTEYLCNNTSSAFLATCSGHAEDSKAGILQFR